MKKVLAMLLALTLALSLAACQSPNNPSGTSSNPSASTSTGEETNNTGVSGSPSTDGTVTIGYTGTHDCYHPSSTVSNNYMASSILYDMLFEVDDETGEYGSRILSDYGWEEDGLTLRLTLKDGIYFADGTQMTAEDVLYSLYMYVAPGGRTDKYQHYKYIDFDAAYASEDGLTAYVVWTIPYSPAIGSLNCPILSKAFLETYDESDEIWYNAPLGSGPYEVKECVIDSYVTFALRDDYWAADEYSYDCQEITIRYYTDETAMYVDYQNYTLDAIYNISTNICEQIEAAGNQGVVNYVPLNDVTLLCFNSANEYLNDPAVREAIAHALDMNAIAEVGYGLLQTPATDHFSTAFDCYVEHENYNYDPEYAAQVLADAGYESGEITIEFVAANVDPQPAIAELVQAYLEAIGINVTVTNYDLGTALQYFQSGENDIALMSVTGGNATCIAMQVFNSMTADTPMIDRAITDETFNGYISEGMNSNDPEVYNAAFAAASQWLWDNYHALPIAEVTAALAYHDGTIASFNQSCIGRGCLGSIKLVQG